VVGTKPADMSWSFFLDNVSTLVVKSDGLLTSKSPSVLEALGAGVLRLDEACCFEF
jgi:hypothetical protein